MTDKQHAQIDFLSMLQKTGKAYTVICQCNTCMESEVKQTLQEAAGWLLEHTDCETWILAQGKGSSSK